ncbi:MAG: hypothetical protein AB1402_09960 [Bacillota bacterium]
MIHLFAKKRVSIIVEGTYKDAVIELIENSGASGFTVYGDICGKGQRGMKRSRGGVADVSCNVEVAVIAGVAVTDRILLGLRQMMDQGIMLVVHVTDVQVMRDRYFS